MPLISVIIPTHNRCNLLKEAINSVLQQTFTDYELIIIDDASTDETEKFINSIKTSKLIYIKNFVSKGGSAARNIGLERATGEYVAFLDDDDIWLKNKLHMQVDILRHRNSIGIVSCNNFEINSNMQIIRLRIRCQSKNSLIKSQDAFNQMMINNFIGGASNVLIRKCALDEICGFNSDLKSAQETNLYIRLLSKGWDLYICEKPLLLYRIHNQNRITDNYESKLSGLNELINYKRTLFINIPIKLQKQAETYHLYELYNFYAKHKMYNYNKRISTQLLYENINKKNIQLFIKSLYYPLLMNPVGYFFKRLKERRKINKLEKNGPYMLDKTIIEVDKVKKILLFTHEFPPKIGGAGIVAEEITSNLPKDSIDITVLTNKIRNRDHNKDYKLIEVITIPKLRPFFYWMKILKMNLYSYDKIILNDIGAALTASLFFNKELMQKCIIFLHGSEPEKIFVNKNLLFSLIKFKSKYVELLENCTNIIAVSEFMKTKFLNITGLHIFKEKITVIYNGISNNLFYNEPIDLYKELDIKTDMKIILTVSRVVKNKGYESMFNILNKLVIQGYNYHWIIIGDGDFLDDLKDKAKKYNIYDYISFLGQVSRMNLRKYYSSADVFLLLSNFMESLGLVYLESIACGTPVIANNTGGVKEVIKEGKNGFLVNNEEEAMNLLKTNKYENLEFTCLDSKFDISTNINKLVDIL